MHSICTMTKYDKQEHKKQEHHAWNLIITTQIKYTTITETVFSCRYLLSDQFSRKLS